MSDFDQAWKLTAFNAAVKEQLDRYGELKFDELFTRAKEIYNEGYDRNIQAWAKKAEFEFVKEEPKKEELKAGHKICPKCGDQCPIKWVKHTYDSKGKPCGHKFSEEPK